MLTIFRRHKKNCAHRSKGRVYRRCLCPIAIEGFAGEKYIRDALKTSDWNRASDIARQWEADGERDGRLQPVSIREAAEKFLADAQARNLAAETLKKYRALFERLNDFARLAGYELLRDLDVDSMSRFRGTWTDGARTSQKNLERLRAFFRFTQARRWITENPASELKAPKVTALPTLPFVQDEMMGIFAATEAYREHAQNHAKLNAIRLRSLILALRYSGLRLGDAVSLSPDRLSADDKLFLYTAKTGVPVRVKLPAFVADALRKTPMMDGRYWFRTTEAKLRTAVSRWQNRLSALSKAVRIHVHAHRFRDTFAVELLLSGVPLERVSVLLGHQSVRITERHYAPWVHARQEQLEADLQRAWSRDPLVLLQQKSEAAHAN